MSLRKYQPRTSLQAIDPQAFFGLFSQDDDRENSSKDEMTIVNVRGPLTHHGDWWTDSYDSIRDRVIDACKETAPIVVMRIDSPGGDVSGCFDTARAIRADCKKAGKKLLVHVDGSCCSAAYALATAGDRIFASRTANIGSIGVISIRADETKSLENYGVKINLITSGDRKADGNPCIPMTKDELGAIQGEVDGLADEFFELVSVRRGIKKEKIAAFEAASFRGDAAIDSGLVDELGSFDHMLASIGAEKSGDTMNEEEKKARESLRSIAEDEECSEEERERARKALAALDEEEESAEDEEEEGAEDEEEDVDAEDEEEDEGAEDDEEDVDAEDEEEEVDSKKAFSSRKVSASTASAILARGSKLEKRLRRLERREAALARKRLIAAHGGVPKGMAKILEKKPLAEVKALLAELPKPRKPKLGDAASTTSVGGTRGAGQDKRSMLSPEESKAMRQAMGLEKETFGVVEDGNTLMLGAPKQGGGK